MGMLQVEFKVFQEILVKNRDKLPVVHCLEDEERFIFVAKGFQDWKYTTMVKKEDIESFATNFNISKEDALDQFRMEYCRRAIPLTDNAETIEVLGTISKDAEIDAGDDVVDESENYEEFLANIVKNWETKTLKALDSLNSVTIDKKFNPEFEKTFNEFFARLTRIVNTTPFIAKITKFVRQGLVAGMESAEEELDVQVGFTEEFRSKLMVLSDQQLTGYNINGKKWYGIKGASQNLQIKILKQVRDDVINKVSRKEMSKNIQKVFEGVGETSANAIARTETTRFINEGKLTAYKESGIKLKAWSAVGDSHTSDVDKRLHAKYFNNPIPVDEPFIDDKTNKAYMVPPSHPNCRCVIEARTE